MSIATGIKRYKSIIQKKKKKHNKRLLLAKSKLSSIEVLISKALIDSSISSHDKFVLINNVLKAIMIWKKKPTSYRIKQFIENFSLFIKQCYHTVWSVEKILKVKAQNL